MKNLLKTKDFLLLVFVLCGLKSYSQSIAENPCIRFDAAGDTIYTADASAHVWADGRLYIYPSHDVAPPKSCDLMDKYHVFSTDDMVNWIDHGQILEASQVLWGRPEGGFMWAPDCAYKDGTYYFYFPHPSDTDWNNTWKIGIATSTKPASDFTVQGYLELPGDQHAMIDPTVFVDDDGQAYFYYGGGNKCMAGKLKANMTELEDGLIRMEGLQDFHEGTWIHKRNGIYYLSYADNFKNGYTNNQLQYATSTNPLGPWTSHGVYLGGTAEGTNHGSIVEYKGQWYAFYHNNVLSAGKNYKGAARSVCVDKLYYNEDGTIQRVYQTGLSAPDPIFGVKNIPNTFLAENYTTGGEGITWHDSDAVNEGEIYRHDGVDIEPCSDGNANIFNIEAGEWLDYQLNIPTTANYKFEFRMASPQGNGQFHVEVDGVDKTGSISVPTTGGFQTWTTFSVSNIALTQGTRTFRFYMEESGFNFAGFVISFALPDVPVDKQIAIKNGSYYVTFDTQNQVICNSSTLTPNCVFTVEKNGNFIELKAANGQYISTSSTTNPMTLYGNNRTAATKFLWHNLLNNSKTFGLKSLRTNAVVCSENGLKAMNCNRYDFGGWEKFIWEEYKSSAIENPQAESNSLEIYPMPAASNSFFTVRFDAHNLSPVSAQIINMQGRICRQTEQVCGNGGHQEISMSTSGVPSGSYLLQVTSAGFSATKKLIII
jgi:hypothetical protein